MATRTFDPSIWNLGLPLGVALGCGPLVPTEDTDADSGSNSDPTDPTQTTHTTMDPTDPTTGGKCPEVPCPYGYECVDGSCQYTGCADYCCEDDCCPDGCCYGEDCGYGCYNVTQCGDGLFCDTDLSCHSIPQPPMCAPQPDSLYALPSVGADAFSLAFVDANGDAARELAVATDNEVFVITAGQPDAVQIPFEPGGAMGDLAAGDLDADGDQDLALFAGGHFQPFLGDGMGNFSAAPETDLDFSGTLDVGDFDGNGILDLLAGTDGGELPRVWIGVPGLSYLPAEALQNTSGYFLGRTVGALDLDALTDIAIQDQYELDIWYGDGSPGGGPSTSVYENVALDVGTAFMIAGDFDGDTVQDLARVISWSGWLLVDGWQGGSLAEYPEWGMPAVPTAVAAGDVDGDGVGDLVIGTDVALAIRYGAGPGQPELFGCLQTVDVGGPPYAIATGDMTGDGRSDVAISIAGGLYLFVHP